jgi:uncharacterized membrane protein
MSHPPSEPEGPLSAVLEQNIRTLIERRQREKDRASTQERIAGAIARFAGSMTFVYLHIIVFGAWILINLGVFPAWRSFDPRFTALYVTTTLEAIFLTAFVLITQNRMSALAERQADLDLQMSLLAEHEITQLITLVSKMAEKLGVSAAVDLAELKKDVSPEQVLDRIDEHEERIKKE